MKLRAKGMEGKEATLDLEVKDAHVIFQSVWDELEEEFGLERLNFPREVIWLNGAPGAGKGTHTQFIMEFRDLTAEPIVVSSLLKSKEARALIDSGMMVGDREVTALVFRALLGPKNQTGVVVDGYPRTKVQVICLKLLYDKLQALRQQNQATKLEKIFHNSMFHIVVLFVDEAESVKRQIMRGEQALQHNREVDASGVGEKIEIRATDLAPKTARKRYQTFKEVTYESLRTLREVFFYHYINAHGTIDEVQDRIEAELRYQSSLELDHQTLDKIDRIPIATALGMHARQELVQRLDSYVEEQSDLFTRVIDLIEKKFIPIIKAHSISGKAIINSEDEVLNEPKVLAMIIDVFSERGYHLVVDVQKIERPVRFDLKTGEIIKEHKRIWHFTVGFPESEIRRER